MRISRDNRGQAAVMTVVFLTALCGMVALVLDVGSWYRADRALQAKADAAALAGAHALPDDTGEATSLAIQYGDKNGGGVTASNVSFGMKTEINDTIKVDVRQPAPGFFSKVFGVSSVMVHAKAAARAFGPNEARYAAPIGVDLAHPYLSGAGCVCFGQQTTLDLQKVGPGAFRLINIDGSHGGTGPSVLASWMLKGFDGYMPLGDYFSDPGARFNASQIQEALQERIGTEMLFPIYDAIVGSGANLQYHVIGWVGFHLTGFEARGSSGKLYGWFTQVIWEGFESKANDPAPDFGVRSIELID